MIEPTQRPRRPPQLIIALVALMLAGMLFGMTLLHLSGPTPRSSNLGTVALLFSVLAFRFNWARAAAVILLVLLTVLSLPGAIANVGHEGMARQTAIYVLLGTPLVAGGGLLVFASASNEYYRQSARWRHARKHQVD